MRLQLATTIDHAWDDHNAYYDVGNLTGIPAHIVNYVNHEKLSTKLDDEFDDYAAMLKTELDQRQMWETFQWKSYTTQSQSHFQNKLKP